MPSSSKPSRIGMWAKPCAAPPPSARPIRGPPAPAASALRLPDTDDDEVAGAEQALCHPPHVVDGDRGDEAVAAVDIVEPEIVHLDGEELLGGSRRRRETEGIAADQIALGVSELVRR